MFRWPGRAVIVVCFAIACSPTDVGEPDTPAPPELDPAIAGWLQANVHPFDVSTVRADHSDLEPLRDIVGSARIVSLGEATHGTRDFFEMKHRMLDFLVREMGFTVFAMEASWPEMNRINDWVQGGDGDPEVLLSGQYFWTWRTQSVLDLLHWARDYNANRGAAPAVSVVGFDMQYPGMAIHNVLRFLERVDSTDAAFAAERFECIDANGPDGLFEEQYRDRDAGYQNACQTDILEVESFLLADRSAQEAATSPDDWELAMQSFRVIAQFEAMWAARADAFRDRFMADNATWLLDRAGPAAKMVLWAHNFHVSTVSRAMGGYLRNDFGDAMVVAGFAFYAGTFNAVVERGNLFFGLNLVTAPIPPFPSYENHFHAAGIPRFLFDLRTVDLSDAGASWLRGPRLFRSIGCCWDPAHPENYRYEAELPAEFDVMIFFDRTTATTILPENMPASF